MEVHFEDKERVTEFSKVWRGNQRWTPNQFQPIEKKEYWWLVTIWPITAKDVCSPGHGANDARIQEQHVGRPVAVPAHLGSDPLHFADTQPSKEEFQDVTLYTSSLAPLDLLSPWQSPWWGSTASPPFSHLRAHLLWTLPCCEGPKANKYCQVHLKINVQVLVLS